MRTVSEKTLELNICAELLGYIRAMPGCAGAFWIGMKQKQEAQNGIDELIQNIPRGLHLALQFKAPRPTPTTGTTRFFTINDPQHQNLVKLSNRKPEAVFYILPHYNTFTAMRVDAPTLKAQTYSLKVADIAALPTATNVSGTHTVESSPPTATIRSDPLESRLTHVDTMIETTYSGERIRQRTDTLLTHQELQAWLREVIEFEDGNVRKIGQRLRGFATACIDS